MSTILTPSLPSGSPAAALGVLNTGDRILAVGDVDLSTASHDTAVEAIRQAGNPLRLSVQSLRMWEGEEEMEEVAGDTTVDTTVGYQDLDDFGDCPLNPGASPPRNLGLPIPRAQGLC